MNRFVRTVFPASSVTLTGVSRPEYERLLLELTIPNQVFPSSKVPAPVFADPKKVTAFSPSGHVLDTFIWQLPPVLPVCCDTRLPVVAFWQSHPSAYVDDDGQWLPLQTTFFCPNEQPVVTVE